MNTTTRLGLKIIDTPAVDTVDQLRQSINTNANILDAQFLESTYALRPAAATKGRLHRSTDTGEIAIDTGTTWEPVWGPASLSRSVLDVGLVGQSRAGRQLAVADFTDCGAVAPLGLWNLGDLTDVSGNSLALSNKGSVPFGVGVEGAAASAAVFAGSTAQALYRTDTGGGDPLRIRTGSWAAWHKSAKSGVDQTILAKSRDTGNQRSYALQQAGGGKVATALISTDGTNWLTCTGKTPIDDDRFHFVVATFDGVALKLYVDGILDHTLLTAGVPLFQSTGPLNIGGYGADSGTAAVAPHFGRVDEGFITAEVLSLDQIRHLYGCRFAHGGNSPRRASLRVTRRRRGVALANGDFPSNPVRCYNLAAGALTELNGGTALTATGGVTTVAGPDGQKDSAILMTSGNHLQASDTGLPAGTTTRTLIVSFIAGAATAGAQVLAAWGTNTTGDTKIYIRANTGYLASANVGDDMISTVAVCDGKWHTAMLVEDNAAADGVKRKLYLDGALIASSTVLNSITLSGANGLRIGANPGGSGTFTGAISRAVVHASALTWQQLQAVWMKAGAMLAASPKDVGAHLEALTATDAVFIGDELESQNLIDMEVSR